MGQGVWSRESRGRRDEDHHMVGWGGEERKGRTGGFPLHGHMGLLAES